MRLPKLLPAFVLVCCGIAGTFASFAQGKAELRVAAASDLMPVMPTLAQAFEQETGTKLTLTYGSSGTLGTQIANGAPFDIFLGADYMSPEKIVAAGLADERDPVPYARGTLVLWARRGLPIQPFGMDLLTDPRVKTVAIANEEHAPYGRAAVSAMQKLKVYETVKPKLVVAENIVQAGQFVESGNAQVGLLSLTLATSPHFREIGQYVLVPFVYPEIRQCAVVMKNSPHRDDAHRFLDWMTSQKVQDRLKDFGLRAVK